MKPPDLAARRERTQAGQPSGKRKTRLKTGLSFLHVFPRREKLESTTSQNIAA